MRGERTPKGHRNRPGRGRVTAMLTKFAIDNLKPRSTRYEVPDGNGLYVVVQPSGRKSFAVRFRIDGRPRKLTLEKGLTLARPARRLQRPSSRSRRKTIRPSSSARRWTRSERRRQTPLR